IEDHDTVPLPCEVLVQAVPVASRRLKRHQSQARPAGLGQSADELTVTAGVVADAKGLHDERAVGIEHACNVLVLSHVNAAEAAEGFEVRHHYVSLNHADQLACFQPGDRGSWTPSKPAASCVIRSISPTRPAAASGAGAVASLPPAH